MYVWTTDYHPVAYVTSLLWRQRKSPQRKCPGHSSQPRCRGGWRLGVRLGVQRDQTSAALKSRDHQAKPRPPGAKLGALASTSMEMPRKARTTNMGARAHVPRAEKPGQMAFSGSARSSECAATKPSTPAVRVGFNTGKLVSETADIYKSGGNQLQTIF